MLGYTLHGQYTRHDQRNGLAVTAGTGVDYKLHSALAIRVAKLEYLNSRIGNLGGVSYSGGLQLSTGVVLRIGTW